MLGAKLFGVGALLIAVTALPPLRLVTAGLGFYLHATYIRFAAQDAILAFALLCGVVASLYYFGDRTSGHRLNNVLILCHFLSWFLAVADFFALKHVFMRAVLSGQDPHQSRLILGGSVAAALAFLIGGVLFVINFAWAIIRKFRTS
jgi:heme/copper-type cytochrome/quinol oxidase subunit 1